MATGAKEISLGDPNTESARGESGRGARKGAGTGKKPSRTKGGMPHGNIADEAGRRAESTAVSQAAEKTFDAAVAKWAESERIGASTGFLLAVKAMVAWLPQKPKMQAVADALERHGLIAHRIRRIQGAGRVVERTTDKAGKPLVNRQNAILLMDVAKWTDFRHMPQGSATVATLRSLHQSGVKMHDGETFKTPLDALASGRYPKTAVHQAWRNAITPPRKIAQYPTTLAVALEKEDIRIPFMIRKGTEVSTEDAAGDREMSIKAVVTLLAKWARYSAYSDSERAMIEGAMEPAKAQTTTPAMPEVPLAQTG